jgi:hypothetical protein
MKLILTAAMMAALASNAFAQPGPGNPQKQTPQQKLEPILPAQPPQVSTGTKPSPVGQPVTSTGTTPGYKPAPPPLKIRTSPASQEVVARAQFCSRATWLASHAPGAAVSPDGRARTQLTASDFIL